MEQTYYTHFNEKKALNAVLYIANKLKRKDFHKIFKILYFADRNHISEYGRSITGDSYIAMGDGPVPSNLYDIFKSVRGDSYFKDNGRFSKFIQIIEWDLIKPLQEANLKALSKTDVKHLDNSLELYGDMSWDEVREKSHDYAWRNTVKNHTISLENIVRESGDDDEYIDYLKEQSQLIQRCR
jgi:uncharacterized phage-associated protein